MATLGMCAKLSKAIYGVNSTLLRQSVNGRNLVKYAATDANASKEPANEGKGSKLKEDAKEAITKIEEKLKVEKEKLTKQVTDIDDKYKRALAETENVRRRMKKQVDDAKLYGIQGFCKDLLEVADVLGKATESVPQDQLTKDNPVLKSLYEGLIMTESQMQKTFTKHGLSVINPEIEEKFDPNFHEALFQQPSDGKKSGTVAMVSKRGYKLHERTIRPAIVGVFK